MNKKIMGVYFICCIYNYLEIVEEQLSILHKGLLQKTNKLVIFITKYNDACVELDTLLNKYNTCNNIILVKSPDNLYEKFAINNYKHYINEDDYYIYYFHTKGLSRTKPSLMSIFSSRRKILNYYTLDKYDVNIQLLEKYDAVGCSAHLYPKKHFSGNFWWSKSSYVKKLQNINAKYLSPEMYILSNDTCKHVSLANDTNTILFDKYQFRDDTEIIKNATSNLIICEHHKKLLFMCE